MPGLVNHSSPTCIDKKYAILSNAVAIRSITSGSFILLPPCNNLHTKTKFLKWQERDYDPNEAVDAEFFKARYGAD